MNTVGKKGKLGERVRCVVSVVDAHRGLGRQHGHPHPRHPRLRQPAAVRAGRRPRPAPPLLRARTRTASSSPSTPRSTASRSRSSPATSPPTRDAAATARDRGRVRCRGRAAPADHVPQARRIPGRDPRRAAHLRHRDDADASPSSQSTVPNWVRRSRASSVSRRADRVDDRRRPSRRRSPTELRDARLLDHSFTAPRATARPWLFPQLVEIAQQWLDACVDVEPGYDHRPPAASTEGQRTQAAEAICQRDRPSQAATAGERLRPMLRRFDPVGSTDERRASSPARWSSRREKSARQSRRCSTARTATRGSRLLAAVLRDCTEDVAAYVKNDHLGFAIPYVHKGSTHAYVPDFLVRLAPPRRRRRAHADRRGVRRRRRAPARPRRRPTPRATSGARR